MALHLSIDIQGNPDQTAVVPPGGHRVQKPGEIPLRLYRLIPLFQHIVHGLEHQHSRLALVTEPEIGVQIQQVPALPEELGAERMDGRDLRLIDQRGLPPQMAVPRALCKAGRQFLHDPSPELGSGGFGIGNDQETVDVQPLLLHPGEQALHQHPGLTGAGSSRDQQSSAAVLHRRTLFLRQRKPHLLTSYFSVSSAATACQNASPSSAGRYLTLSPPRPSSKWQAAA